MILPEHHPILKFITLCDHLLTILGGYILMAYSGSDDGIIEGLTEVDLDDLPTDEVIETNRDDLETVQKNQQRMYAYQRATRRELRSLFFKGIGVLVTLMVATMGLVGTVIVL